EAARLRGIAEGRQQERLRRIDHPALRVTTATSAAPPSATTAAHREAEDDVIAASDRVGDDARRPRAARVELPEIVAIVENHGIVALGEAGDAPRGRRGRRVPCLLREAHVLERRGEID